MARLTLARKIATIVLIVWKKGVCFDAQHQSLRSCSRISSGFIPFCESPFDVRLRSAFLWRKYHEPHPANRSIDRWLGTSWLEPAPHEVQLQRILQRMLHSFHNTHIGIRQRTSNFLRPSQPASGSRGIWNKSHCEIPTKDKSSIATPRWPSSSNSTRTTWARYSRSPRSRGQ